MVDYSEMKFGEYEEVAAWADELDHDACCRILSEDFDNPMHAHPTDWRDYYTLPELRDFTGSLVARACNVPT